MPRRVLLESAPLARHLPSRARFENFSGQVHLVLWLYFLRGRNDWLRGKKTGGERQADRPGFDPRRDGRASETIDVHGSAAAAECNAAEAKQTGGQCGADLHGRGKRVVVWRAISRTKSLERRNLRHEQIDGGAPDAAVQFDGARDEFKQRKKYDGADHGSRPVCG